MDEATNAPEGPADLPDSPKPLAFTIDFGSDKKIDTQRHKTLAEKFQKRHKRGQSLSKLDDAPPPPVVKQHPLSANLPRKSSFQSEGYFSSDEKTSKLAAKRSDLTLFLRTNDRMTQSFPSEGLPSITSPEECALNDVSSPELDIISPEHATCPMANNEETLFTEAKDFDFDKKSDTLSDAGTYTVEADNYSEEQKAKMSIDKDFQLEQVSVRKKTEEYVRSLVSVRETVLQSALSRPTQLVKDVTKTVRDLHVTETHVSPAIKKTLSPILSPTQNMSVTSPDDTLNKTFTKIMFPSPRAKQDGLEKTSDRGSVISVTSSGAFRVKPEEKKPERKLSLTKSEIHVEAYIDGKLLKHDPPNECVVQKSRPKTLTANIVNVQNIGSDVLVIGNVANCGLPPPVGGKTSPTKIPSPIHTLSRPRSRNSISGSNVDFSDTEVILKPTQHYINTLQQRLSLDSDADSDYDAKYGLQLNNTAHLLKQKTSHTRHNSLDDRTMNNKLEHFQNKNLQGIDQTYSNLLNQYSTNRVIHKIQNSPNNSPIRRSSSFSAKNHLNSTPKNTNVQKELKHINSPASIQRSSSSASIKPIYATTRRGSVSDHKKIDRSQFGDTESSSEEEFDPNVQKRKDFGNISNTRCNRAFSLRRARIDNDPPKCPNTPEMRRKTMHLDGKPERAISVDRKPMRTNDVQSRYLLNVTKRNTPPPVAKEVKNVPKTATPGLKKPPQGFSRTDSGRFSMRTPKPVAGAAAAAVAAISVVKSAKKDGKKQANGGRSNSSLSSREVDFQNWKRRKSYDPMKAAAEGKRKEMQKKMGQNVMTQSFTESSHSPDSSPSHSSSVHRSQSFHGTAALEQLISSDEDDLTLSADEGFSPPTPSPCELSPARATLRQALWERINH